MDVSSGYGREMNKQSRRGFLYGTNIRILSLKFFNVIALATAMTIITLGAALVFSIVWIIGRVAGAGSGRKAARVKGDFSLVCVSHVPWDAVWQRNQQTMLRLSRSEKVVYLRTANTLEISANTRYLAHFFGNKVSDDLLVINPVILWGDTRFGLIRRLNRWILLSFIRFGMVRAGFGRVPIVLWFYFPRCEYICGGLGECLVVYDLQDEYATGTNATRDIAARERRLLERADIVFKGTNSLRKKKHRWNKNIHFVQNGVESDHFSRAAKDETEIPEDLKQLPHPVIGYFGLIGDRVDVSILEMLADTHPEWSIVLVGPVREEMCTVPERKNIYLMGQKEYESLPGYLKGFDVAVIPYVLNETTMDLNPTKLLEYLSGGKPVVSTAMTDVVELFGDYVGVARNREEFLALTERAVESPDEVLIKNGMEFAGKFTWEAMTERMRKMILGALGPGGPAGQQRD